MVKFFNQCKQITDIFEKPENFGKLIQLILALFVLSSINSLLGNFFTLFVFVNGFFAYTYLKANKKGLLDNIFAKVNGILKKVQEKIPKYNE